jgi:hypothetical protein
MNVSQFYVQGSLEVNSDLLVGPTWPEKPPTLLLRKRSRAYLQYLPTMIRVTPK